MKFICKKQTLYDAVINTSKAVSDRSSNPLLEGIRFHLDGSLLELTGYDLEIGIRTSVLVNSEDECTFIADPRLFSEMVKKMPEEDIMVEISESFHITISGGLTTYNLSAVDGTEYPELPEKETKEVMTISQPVLKNMINQSIFATAVTDSKPILKGELFEIQNSVLTMVAIDGYRLAVRKEPIKFDDVAQFVVPAKSLAELAKLLSDDENDFCKMYLSEKHMIFEIGAYLVYSRLLEGEFHPYRSAIPENFTTEVIVDRKELMTSLERAALIIDDKVPTPLRCHFENGQIKFDCTTKLGKIQDEISADIAGPVIEIGFKCKYLYDPLKVINDDKVKLQMSGSLLPMKIVPLNGDSYTYLVLPVRLKTK